MPSLVNNSYDTQAAEKGQVISIPVPSAITTAAVVPGPYAPDSGSVTPTTAQITLSYWQEAAFTLSESELAQTVAGYAPRQMTAAIAALAEYVNGTIFSLIDQLGQGVGTPGTAPFASAPDNAVNMKELLTVMKAPLADRRMVLDTVGMGSALKLAAFQYGMYSSDPNVMREGAMGRKFGFDWFEDQQVPYHTAGTITTGLAVKTGGGGAAAGVTSFLATTAVSTGACALKSGDIITIAGCERTYSLSANATQASAATDVTLNLYQPLTAASAAIMTGAQAITVTASHRENVAFQADCFGFACRTLAPIAGAEPNPYSMEVADPVSGLTLRLQVREEFHRIRWAFDMLWGGGVVREPLGARMFG
jgi:hypothetical protein